jgi:hypothetical protein
MEGCRAARQTYGAGLTRVGSKFLLKLIDLGACREKNGVEDGGSAFDIPLIDAMPEELYLFHAQYYKIFVEKILEA